MSFYLLPNILITDIYVYMCVCTYTYMCVFVCLYVYMWYMFLHVWVCMCVSVCVLYMYLYVYGYVCVSLCVSLSVWVCVSVWVYACVCLHLCVCLCVCESVFVCLCVSVCVSMWVCLHIYICDFPFFNFSLEIEIGSHTGAQADLKVMMASQSPECWFYQCVPPTCSVPHGSHFIQSEPLFNSNNITDSVMYIPWTPYQNIDSSLLFLHPWLC